MTGKKIKIACENAQNTKKHAMLHKFMRYKYGNGFNNIKLHVLNLSSYDLEPSFLVSKLYHKVCILYLV